MINFSVMAALLYSCSQIAGASRRRQANCSNGFEKCREWWSLRLRRGCFDGPARLSPGTKSALDMRDWFEAHALRSLRGKSRAQTTGAKKTNFLSWANIGLWYGLWGSIQNSSIPRGQ